MMITETKNSIVPMQEVFHWMHDKLHPEDSRISGKSLKYIISQQSVIIFHLEDSAFKDYKNKLSDMNLTESESFQFSLSDHEVKFQVSLSGRLFHFIYKPESKIHTDGEIRISTDFLTYDAKSSSWTGNPEYAKDLDEKRLRILSPESFDLSGVFQIAAILSMMNIEAEDELLFQFRSFQHDEYAQLSKKFLSKIFRKIVTGAKPSNAFIALERIGLLDFFLPELARGRGLSQNRFHKYDIFMHSVYTCDAVPEPDIVLRLSALFHDLGKVETRKVKSDGEASFHNHEMVSTKHADRILKRFGFDSRTVRQVKFLVRNHMFHYTTEWSDRAVRRFMTRVGPDDMEDLIRLRLADRSGSGKRTALPRAIKDLMRHIEELRAKEAEFKIKDLAINGHTLQDMGLEPGPAMGKILQILHAEVMEEKITNEETVLKERAQILIQEISRQS